jgi:hypothetical protein
MSITTKMSPAVPRSRALSSSYETRVRLGSWRGLTPSFGSPVSMRTESALGTNPVHHNSIVLADTARVNAAGVFGAAKQAAPPRRVPR